LVRELGYTPWPEVVVASKPTVLMVASDVVGSRMAGPGIRVVEMCRVLAQHAAVTLAVEGSTDLRLEGVEVVRQTPRSLAGLAAAAEVVVCPGLTLARFPYLASYQARVVVDAYDPFWIAVLEQQRHKSLDERAADELHTRTGLVEQLRLGDFFLCATERQRDMLLGGLWLLGRLGPALRQRDPSLRSLVATVPFGLPSAPPKPAARSLVRGVMPGVGQDDLLLLWAGGIYNWFDPVSLVRAVGLVTADHPEVKLVFFGGTHPNPAVPSMRVAAEALQAARAEGLLDRQVFFLDQWIPYEERAGYLLDADVGVSAHLDNAETTFAFRTRFLDYLWAGLPVLCTGGDELGDLAGERGFGLVVPPGASWRGWQRLLGPPPPPSGGSRPWRRWSSLFAPRRSRTTAHATGSPATGLSGPRPPGGPPACTSSGVSTAPGKPPDCWSGSSAEAEPAGTDGRLAVRRTRRPCSVPGRPRSHARPGRSI
jgi:glycosyltransferase involved in cell wall biosynthesis